MTSKIKVDQIENTDGSGDVAFTGTNGIKLDTIKSSGGTTGLTVASTGNCYCIKRGYSNRLYDIPNGD